MISFSIVIPVYKTKEYLDCCVESVVAQSYRNFEIILIDDGSPDNCGKLCDGWTMRDSRIKVIHRENGGLSAARNTGIRHASADYIMFLDSDDWWANDTVLEAIAGIIERTDAEVVSFNYRKSYHGQFDAPYFSFDFPDSVQSESFSQMMEDGRYITGACNKAIRRTLITENNLFFKEGITAEDIDWTLRTALAAETFAFSNICVFIYRQIAASISHNMTPEKVDCLCGNVRECVRLIDDADVDQAEGVKAFVAYQYGTLLHNAANLPKSQRSKQLMDGIREMKWLLKCSDNRKIRLLRRISRFGIPLTFAMLRLRQKMLGCCGKGV